MSKTLKTQIMQGCVNVQAKDRPSLDFRAKSMSNLHRLWLVKMNFSQLDASESLALPPHLSPKPCSPPPLYNSFHPPHFPSPLVLSRVFHVPLCLYITTATHLSWFLFSHLYYSSLGARDSQIKRNFLMPQTTQHIVLTTTHI